MGENKYSITYPIENQLLGEAAFQKIFETASESLFHYTSREVFWKIIEDESLLARHILFSNDFEEYELGKTLIQNELNLKDDDNENAAIHNEKYMVCFCKEDDLLSQWRGYAQNGIAMNFDFSLGIPDLENNMFSPYHCFTLVNNGTIPQKSELFATHDGVSSKFAVRYLSQDLNDAKEYITLCVAAPRKIYYTERNKKSDELVIALEKLEEMDDIGKSASKIIPYIKNYKFEEEKEYRLVFNLTDLYKPQMERFIGEKVTYLDVNGIRKPNIRVEFGNALDYMENKPIKIYFRNETYKPSLEELAREMHQNVTSINIKPELISHMALKDNEILLSNGISQEKTAWKLYELFAEKRNVFSSTKLWCDGHLPIRQIIVGPSKDAELMKKSIIQYKNNKYWMKSIHVKVSDIPYRD